MAMDGVQGLAAVRPLAKKAQLLVPFFIWLGMSSITQTVSGQPDSTAPPKAHLTSLDCFRPEYTPAARRAEIQCFVEAEYVAEASGWISEVRIQKTCGDSVAHKQLDRSVIDAIKGCRATPGVDTNLNKVRSTGRLVFSFRLE